MSTTASVVDLTSFPGVAWANYSGAPKVCQKFARTLLRGCAGIARPLAPLPPMEKKNKKPCFVIGCIIVSIGSHALGEDVAYNADDKAGQYAPHSSLLIL